MASMNIFRNDAFSVTSLSGMVERLPYVPSLLGSLGIFEDMPVRHRTIFVDRRENGLELIPTTADGAPPVILSGEERDLVPMRTTRLAKRFTLYAHEVEGIRAFGTESELESVQAEYARRAQRLKNDMEATHEFHRLGALQGILLDADGVTVLRDYFTEFGVTKPAAINVPLTSTTPGLRGIFTDIARSMIRGSGGAMRPGSGIHALAGDDFYDALITHPEVERTYLNWAAAAELRNNLGPFESFTFGGITWHNYRGTDDNTTIAIPAAGARLFPVGVPNVFKKAMAPLETLGFIGSPGQNTYMMNIPDRDRDMWTMGEIYSYPLYFCQRPDLLRTLAMT